MAEFVGARAVRLGASCDLCCHGPADRDPGYRGARSTAAETSEQLRGLALLGVALMLAGFRVDAPMLSGGDPETWNGWVHASAFLLIIATGVLAPLTTALAVRSEPGWRPIAVVSVAASVLFVVFLFLPWAMPRS